MSDQFWYETEYQKTLMAKERQAAIDWFARCVFSLFHAGKRVLDVGCGPAVLAHVFKRYGYEVDSVDISKAAYDLALEPIRIADVTMEEPVLEDAYDITICAGLADLLNYYDMFAAMSYVGRSTRINGWIIVAPGLDDATPYYPAHVLDAALRPFANPGHQISAYLWYAYTNSDVWTNATSYATARAYRRIEKDLSLDKDWCLDIEQYGTRTKRAAERGNKRAKQL